jgi:hypothetical protein
MVHIPTWLLAPMIYFPSSGLAFLRGHVQLSNGIARRLILSRLSEANDVDTKGCTQPSWYLYLRPSLDTNSHLSFGKYLSADRHHAGRQLQARFWEQATRLQSLPWAGYFSNSQPTLMNNTDYAVKYTASGMPITLTTLGRSTLMRSPFLSAVTKVSLSHVYYINCRKCDPDIQETVRFDTVVPRRCHTAI